MNFNFKLVACIIIPMLIAGGLNGFLLRRQSQDTSITMSPLLPPGWTIGLIWTILFGIMGYIFYLYIADPIVAVSITILFVSCLAYPFYTKKFKSKRASSIGNLLTLIFAFMVTIIIAMRCIKKKDVLFMMPLLTWTIYVNLLDAIQ